MNRSCLFKVSFPTILPAFLHPDEEGMCGGRDVQWLNVKGLLPLSGWTQELRAPTLFMYTVGINKLPSSLFNNEGYISTGKCRERVLQFYFKLQIKVILLIMSDVLRGFSFEVAVGTNFALRVE